MHTSLPRWSLAWVAVVVAVAACHAKVTSDLKLDGKPFVVTGCRSGGAFGFSGIQLTDDAGTRIRLVAQVDGSTGVAVFAPNADRGDSLGACGTLEMHAQNSRINNVRNMEGNAKLSCSAVGRTLEGSVTFENCH